MKACCELILLILKMVQSGLAKLAQHKRQKESAAIDDDPVAWSNKHFASRVRDDKTEKTDDADRDKG